ncbi:MAG: hypothetical protein MJZ11_10640 [Lachnospiraceae bacterium]|nr:hypothetical protein [Lachnospiraceae bacterium]
MGTMNNAANANNLTDAQKIAFDMMCDCQKPIVKHAWDEYATIIESLGQTLQKLPPLYSQDDKGYDAIVHAHYFVGGTDIFITEREGNELFGYTILNGDYEMSEMGYSSLAELKSIRVLNLDFHWEPKTLREALKDISSYFDKI